MIETIAHARRRFSRRGPARLSVSFTPLIDVVFLLLLYFLLVAQFKTKEELFELDLPRDASAETARDPFALPIEPIRIRVESTGDGRHDFIIRSDDPFVGSPESLEALDVAMKQGRTPVLIAEQIVLVQPTPGTRWEHALAIINAIKRAGFRRVHFLEPSP